MEPSINPFAAVSLIVAPAILTNASAVLAMSTSNRLARAADRARELRACLDAGSRRPAAGSAARRRVAFGRRRAAACQLPPAVAHLQEPVARARDALRQP